MENIKKYIPNSLAILRIILTIIIVICGSFGKTNIIIILAVIAALSDLVDGKLARKWNVTSLIGAKLDAVADKIFAIGIIGCLISKFTILWIPFALEIIIGLTNLYYHSQSNKTESLMIGKIKTVFLFTTVIIAVITTSHSNMYSILQGMIYASINLQFLSLFKYTYNFFNQTKEITIDDNEMHKKIMEEEIIYEIEEYNQTMILEDLQKLAQEYEYNNETDDIN